jgi:hypothetical protein
MATAAEMQQFVSLWSLVMQVQRSNEPDQFTWRFTTSGVYTSSSAYRAQFHGSYAHYEWNRVWKAPVEPKCKFFSWLLLQNKLWTADWLARHGNPANTICQLSHAAGNGLPHHRTVHLLNSSMDTACKLDGDHEHITAIIQLQQPEAVVDSHDHHRDR